MREAAGIRTIAISGAEIREAEPTLAPIYRSGLLLPDNGRVKDPHQLTVLLSGEFEKHGGTVVKGKASTFTTAGKHVTAIVVDGRPLPLQRVVIAAGIGSRELASALGIEVPLEAERGYHINVHDSNVMPRVTVTNRDLSFACAPMSVGLRVAGTAEFAGVGSEPDWSRTELLQRQALKMFPGLRLGKVTRWAGDRPSFPDGLPALGPAPGYDNAWFAFGNGHFGITGGPVMGKYVAQIVAGRTPDIDVAPYSPARFG
jgi:D-amino-acid dehydrogenase